MRAKYYCSEVEKIDNSVVAHLNGVPGINADDDANNNQFNLADPIGSLQIWVDHPEAKDFFKKGVHYYLDISKVE